MSKMQHLQGSILTPQGWVDGEITFTDRIENVRAGDAATSGKTYILPGFIDLHVHGAGGKDRKSTRLNSSHSQQSRMPSSA